MHDHMLISQVNLLHQILVSGNVPGSWDETVCPSPSTSYLYGLTELPGSLTCSHILTFGFVIHRTQICLHSELRMVLLQIHISLSTPVPYSLDTTTSGDLGGVDWCSVCVFLKGP